LPKFQILWYSSTGNYTTTVFLTNGKYHTNIIIFTFVTIDSDYSRETNGATNS